MSSPFFGLAAEGPRKKNGLLEPLKNKAFGKVSFLEFGPTSELAKKSRNSLFWAKLRPRKSLLFSLYLGNKKRQPSLGFFWGPKLTEKSKLSKLRRWVLSPVPAAATLGAHNCKGMTVAEEQMTFDEWMKIGIELGWCGPPVCYTHDGLPMALAEDEEFERGSDPCLHIIRLYDDGEHRAAVEESHSPSQWRNHYK